MKSARFLVCEPLKSLACCTRKNIRMELPIITNYKIQTLEKHNIDIDVFMKKSIWGYFEPSLEISKNRQFSFGPPLPIPKILKFSKVYYFISSNVCFHKRI